MSADATRSSAQRALDQFIVALRANEVERPDVARGMTDAIRGMKSFFLALDPSVDSDPHDAIIRGPNMLVVGEYQNDLRLCGQQGQLYKKSRKAVTCAQEPAVALLHLAHGWKPVKLEYRALAKLNSILGNHTCELNSHKAGTLIAATERADGSGVVVTGIDICKAGTRRRREKVRVARVSVVCARGPRTR